MDNTQFERTFVSDVFAVKPIITEALEYIKTMMPGISEENEYELKLIFSELLFNSVIHGNQLDEIRKVNIGLDVIDDVVSARVSDEGMGFDYNNIINQFDSPENFMKENGRGIRLVHTLTDDLQFNSNGTCITFHKKVLCDG